MATMRAMELAVATVVAPIVLSSSRFKLQIANAPWCLRQWPEGYNIKWRCMSSGKEDDYHMPSRLALKQAALDALPEYEDLDKLVSKVGLDQVVVSFAWSGGASGQNVNKVNTKVDMRFNVMKAEWLPLRIREKLLVAEKNRVNSDGELVISSTRTRT